MTTKYSFLCTLLKGLNWKYDRLNWTPRAFALVAINSYFMQFNNNGKRVQAYATSRASTLTAICIQPIHKHLCHIVKWIGIPNSARNRKITQKAILLPFATKREFHFNFSNSCKFSEELWLFLLFLYELFESHQAL